MSKPTPGGAPRFAPIALLQRYAAIFRLAWARRAELAGPERLVDELAYLPAAMALQETPPHPAPRRAAIAICALFAGALLWSVFGWIDIVTVAQGRILVSQRSKQIQPLETSVVRAIRVRDGDHVAPGQLLIELDPTNSDADGNRIGQDLAAAWSELLRARSLLASLDSGTGVGLMSDEHLGAAETKAAQGQLSSEWADMRAKLAKLEADIMQRHAEVRTADQLAAKLQALVPMSRARENDFQSLTKQGFVSHHASQDRTRERVEQERDLATAQARQNETVAGLNNSQQARLAYVAESRRVLRDRLGQAELKVRQWGEEARKAAMRKTLTRLTASVAGTVQQLAVHTEGGVVTPAQVLMVLVPDDAAVTAEVQLENKDIGFVRVGQAASVKLETFPYTRYGTVAARLQSLSADAVVDEKRGATFAATLAFAKPYIEVDGRRVKLAPGMNITAEVKTGRRRVIDFWLSPLQERVQEALRER